MRALGLVVLVVMLLVGCALEPEPESGAVTTADANDETTSLADAQERADAQPTATSSPTVVVVAPIATPVPQPSPVAAPTLAPPMSTAAPSGSPTSLPATADVPSAAAPPAVTVTPSATAAPTPTATATPTPTVDQPLDENGEKDDLPPSDYAGDVLAVRTQTGVVVPVRGASGDTYVVVTPCYNLASISGGLAITGPLDVLIDPGHGGEESGAVGPNGLKESTVNLLVAELLRAELMTRGYTVELTRYGDHRVAIQSRAELANALAPRVFISIHHNGGFPESFPVAGTEVFVQLDDPESARLGGIVFEEIQAAFANIEADWMGSVDTFGVAWRQNDEGTDLYGVLRRTPDIVSILTEAMFISTEAEADLLAQPDILETEAQALADAFDRWFDTEDPGSGYVEGVVFEGDLGNGGGAEGCVDPDH